MGSETRWLRTAFWAGALIDAVMTVVFCIPQLFLRLTGADLALGSSLMYGLAMGAPLMLGWTLLLVWASRSPLERKGVALCLIPVLLGFIAVEIISVSSGVAPLTKIAPMIVLQVALILACTGGYLAAAKRQVVVA